MIVSQNLINIGKEFDFENKACVGGENIFVRRVYLNIQPILLKTGLKMYTFGVNIIFFYYKKLYLVFIYSKMISLTYVKRVIWDN